MKPINYYTFSMKLKLVLKRVEKKDKEQQSIMLHLADGIKKLDIRHIYYVEIQSKMLYYYTMKGTYSVKGTLQSVEESVEIYESIVKTGNDVFDTILTQKSLYCQKRGIQVTCVADGSQMDFIETIDLYAILGNALDNAIEAVEKFSDPEKRQIDVMIHRNKKFLVMNFMNPIPEKLVFRNEFPITTKDDKKHHGFGLRSIQHFVRKYDGVMNIGEEDGCFSLKIMIPIATNELAKNRFVK